MPSPRCCRVLTAVLVSLLFAATAQAQYSLVRTFANPVPRPNDRFASALAADGAALLIGDPDPLNAIATGGAAYRFDTATGALLTTYLNPTPNTGDDFGHALAVVGSYVAVGAPQDDAGGHNAGAVHIFDRTTGVFVRTILAPSPPSDSDRFGAELGVLGTNLIVGAPYTEIAGSILAGRVYLFDPATGGLVWSTDDPTVVAYESFGSSLAVSGADVIVAAGGDTAPGVQSGAVYLLDGATGAILKTYLNPAPELYDGFGSAVAVLGSKLVVGAMSDHLSDEGTVYVFDVASAGLLATIAAPNPLPSGRFGSAVDILAGDILVGAQSDFGDPGFAYLFDGATYALRQTYANPGTFDSFGHTLAVSGSHFAVATGYSSPGNAYLYAPCGDGVLDPGQACDDGNLIDGDGCDSTCLPTGCGNGTVTGTEECDDGNTANGDCCSATCTFDPSGTNCNDFQAGTSNDVCDGAGNCAGVSIPTLSEWGILLLALGMTTIIMRPRAARARAGRNTRR